MKSSFVVGFLAFFPIAIVIWFAALAALAQEADNRAAERLRQQLQIDKSHMLKLPEIHRRNRTQECQLSDTEIRCIVYPQGELKIAVSQ